MGGRVRIGRRVEAASEDTAAAGFASRRGRALAAIGVGIAAWLLLSASAQAALITVNSTGDPAPSNDGVCTLREAIAAANTDTASGAGAGECAAGDDVNDRIRFSAGVRGSTVVVSSALPQITERVTIDGCNGIVTVDPCAGLATSGSGFGALDVNANSVVIKGLAIQGFDLTEALVRYRAGRAGLQVENNWFGFTVSGFVADIGLGLLLEGDTADVGGATPAERNVFSRTNGAPAIRIFAGDANTVSGNYFGTGTDGDPLSGSNNQRHIDVAGNDLGVGDSPANGNLIGGTVTGPRATDLDCDGACNLFGDSNKDAIDLTGSGSGEIPAGPTTIAGNFIGLTRTGDCCGLVDGVGIDVGQAASVTIGGADVGDRNYMGGNGGGAIRSSGEGLTVRNNFLGLNSAGTASVQDSSISEIGLTGAATDPNVVRDNRIGGGSEFGRGVAYGLQLSGSGATVRGNTFGVGTGGEDVGQLTAAIRVTGSDNTIGVSGAGNTIGFAGFGILIDGSTGGGDGNVVQGNFVGTNSAGTKDLGNDSSGIRLVGDTDDNTIGGDTAALENTISHSGSATVEGDAIRIVASAAAGNLIARNRGFDNGPNPDGLFIDLGNAGVGNLSGAQGGIQAPQIDAGASTQRVSGTADPNAVVRVYRTTDPDGSSPSSIDAFVGRTTANGLGIWTLNCPSATCAAEIPGEARVTATQTDASNNNTSELSTADQYSQAANLSITKSDSPDPMAANHNLTYTLQVANAGPGNATDVTVTDDLPAIVTFVSASAGCSEASGTVTCDLGDFANGQSKQRQIVVQPTQAGLITNTASVSAGEPDPAAGNNTDTEQTQVNEPDLSITKSDSPDPVTANQNLTYTIQVANAGPANATNVQITDDLPAGVNFVSATAGCSEASGTVTCNAGHLVNGQSKQHQIVVQPTQAGQITNTAQVSSDEPDSAGADNSDSEQTQVNTPPSPPPTPEEPTVLDTTPPDTQITDGPNDKTKKKTATFEFTSSESGSTFVCRVDRGQFEFCTSPHTISKLGTGVHIFFVRAIDPAGNLDRTPAEDGFQVKKKRKKKK